MYLGEFHDILQEMENPMASISSLVPCKPTCNLPKKEKLAEATTNSLMTSTAVPCCRTCFGVRQGSSHAVLRCRFRAFSSTSKSSHSCISGRVCNASKAQKRSAKAQKPATVLAASSADLAETDARLPVTVSFDHFLVIDRRICRLINEQAYSAS